MRGVVQVGIRYVPMLGLLSVEAFGVGRFGAHTRNRGLI